MRESPPDAEECHTKNARTATQRRGRAFINSVRHRDAVTSGDLHTRVQPRSGEETEGSARAQGPGYRAGVRQKNHTGEAQAERRAEQKF